MKNKICFILILIFGVATSMYSNDIRRCESKSSGILVFKGDSIDFRPDLTRLYGKIVGKPHTSGRIDSITTNNGMEANDIDGVDFKRYFQWEDDGSILLEIDFPPMKPAKSIVLTVFGPRGSSEWLIEVASD